MHHQLWSQQGPHFSPLKLMIKAHSSGRMVSSGINDVVITSVHSEKTHPKKLMLMLMIMIIKRASGASEVFSLVMKTNNCLRIRVLTRNTCLHLAYVSLPGVCVLTWRTCPQLANMSTPSTSPSLSWVCAQKIIRLPSRVPVQ